MHTTEKKLVLSESKISSKSIKFESLYTVISPIWAVRWFRTHGGLHCKTYFSRFDKALSSTFYGSLHPNKGKGKVYALQALAWPRGWVEVQLYSSKTAALKVGELSTARPGCTLSPGKTRYPLYRRLGGHQGRSGRAENLAPPGFDPRIAQSVVSRYTDWATAPIGL